MDAICSFNLPSRLLASPRWVRHGASALAVVFQSAKQITGFPKFGEDSPQFKAYVFQSAKQITGFPKRAKWQHVG